MSTYKAHIFKQRNVGEREEVKLKIFGPDGEELDLDGSGGGGGSKAISGIGLNGLVEQNIDYTFPFDEAQIEYIEGFEIDGGGLAVTPGVYSVQLRPQWEFTDVHLSGFFAVSVVGYWTDPVSGATEASLFSLQLNSEWSQGNGDRPLPSSTFVDVKKAGMFHIPDNAENPYLILKGQQDGDPVPQPLTLFFVIAKL